MSEKSIQPPADDRIRQAVEAIVFASSEPVRPQDIAEALGDVDVDAVIASLDAITESYARGDGGLVIERVAGGYRLATRPEVGAWVRQYFRNRNRTRLTPSTLEVLAIVAYRQPVTAPEIQEVRGKDPSYGLKVLLEKRMVRILGRKKVVGNPILYGTSRHFLVHFGLDSLGDLPSIDDFDSFLGALDRGQEGLFDDPPAPAIAAEGASESTEPANASAGHDPATGEPAGPDESPDTDVPAADVADAPSVRE